MRELVEADGQPPQGRKARDIFQLAQAVAMEIKDLRPGTRGHVSGSQAIEKMLAQSAAAFHWLVKHILVPRVILLLTIYSLSAHRITRLYIFSLPKSKEQQCRTNI